MEIIENTNQPRNFDKSYITTKNVILLFDNYFEFKNKLNEIYDLGEIEGELYYNVESNNFYVV